MDAEELQALIAEREAADLARAEKHRDDMLRAAATAPTPLGKPAAFIEGFEWARAEAIRGFSGDR